MLTLVLNFIEICLLVLEMGHDWLLDVHLHWDEAWRLVDLLVHMSLCTPCTRTRNERDIPTCGSDREIVKGCDSFSEPSNTRSRWLRLWRSCCLWYYLLVSVQFPFVTSPHRKHIVNVEWAWQITPPVDSQADIPLTLACTLTHKPVRYHKNMHLCVVYKAHVPLIASLLALPVAPGKVCQLS